jgi:prepilin-type N-terminal cleavage/methylation domain-containing protein
MRGARGFSLIELTIAIGLIALFAATGTGLTLANRSLAVAAAASEFDQLLDSARTMARELGGGRLSFAADGDGTIATFAATNPDGTLAPTTIPALHTHAHIAEQDSLGDPAFALVLHADGRLGGIPNAATSEVGCPASGRYHIRITAAGGSADRFLPCRTVLATGGPLAYTVWPPATIAPSPVAQCAGPCTPPPLPTASSPALTCPVGTTPVGDTCIPVPPPTPIPTPTPTVIVMTPTPAPAPPATPTAQPTPIAATCDLVQSGTCYRRIAGPTMETFDKVVSPGYSCDPFGANCEWTNNVGMVTMAARESYSVQPPIAANDDAHHLLFVVDGVAAMTAVCASYDNIIALSTAPPFIDWLGVLTTSAGGGGIPTPGSTVGYGEPAIYAFRHQFAKSTFPIAGVIAQANSDITQYSQTVYQFAEAAERRLYGPVVQSTYQDQTTSQGDYITYIPDFTDCASGLPDSRYLGDQLYGITTAELVIETYQAVTP